MSYALAVSNSKAAPSVIARRRAVGHRIRVQREKAGRSQASVAEAAGLSRLFYLGVEAGRRNISLDNLFAIADALDVDASVFFGEVTSQ